MTKGKGKGQEEEQEEEKKPQAIVQAYRERLTLLKRAQEFSQRGDIPKAVDKYMGYLNALAAYHGTKEDKLTPKLFDVEKDIAELLLVSHAYWDLAKAYDRSPRLRHESVRCLEQFIKFSTGFKFQHVNAQMVKKFVKRRKAYNLAVFQEAYNRIQINSKACYVATHCYPHDEDLLENLRGFKRELMKSRIGFYGVEQYYRFSPNLVVFLEKHPRVNYFVTTILFKPIIGFINKLI
ncbi:hypothetical protein HBN50_16765 [Halobacteriovorax sp. GB3]|uniref:hypothetical protein n=1 Tax=Halobacteriovorax sp. GB3 TaxID=2719615 RepID=UPI0023604E78|nr:hypothetical protein [Halobacteriovorax sp. GB3]MDD0854764.1 hypothetical protein [Halobacteriovorax sp. GB3]